MSVFSNLPVRRNGDAISAAWFNAIRTALVNIFGEGTTPLTTVNILDNQSSPVSISGLSFDGDDYSSVNLELEVKRQDSLEELMEKRAFTMLYKGSSWSLEEGLRQGDDTGVSFTVDTTDGVGQVKYTSTDMTGTGHTGTLKYKATTFDA